MKIGQRDRRALTILGIGIAVWMIARAVLPSPESAPASAAAGVESIPVFEKRLDRLRREAASLPGKEEVLKKASAELAAREKTLIDAQTGQQAQAHLIEIVRNVARQQQPPLELRNLELGQVRPFGADYGEVLASATVECRIEELVNLLAELTAQKEMVALTELRLTSAGNKQKTIGARLTVSGLVPRRLIPEKKGLASF